MAGIRRWVPGISGLATMIAAAAAMADVPRMIHYQGKLRESSGSLVNGSVGLRLRLYGSETAAAPVLFDETHPGVSVASGLFNVLIGSRTAGGVPDSALNAAAVYLGISINGGAELAPRPQVVSNPHAIKARSSEQLVKPGSFDPAAVVDTAGNVGVGTGSPAAKLEISGDGATVLVPRKSDGSDPAEGVDGMIYYNTATGKFRGHENGSWGDMRDGSGSASDPCNCPINPWTLIGVLNSTLAATGGTQPGSIDISDNTKEYLIQGVNRASEFTADNGAPAAIHVTVGQTNTSVIYWVSVLDTSGTWRTGGVDSNNYPNLIRAGALWSSQGTPARKQYLDTAGYNSEAAEVYTDGTVRLYDYSTGYDCAVFVFARSP